MPIALIVLDGLGDLPNPATGGISPVEAAATPNLDGLAGAGRMGQVILIGPGIAPESDAGVLALLGLDPVRDSPGRGVLEALGIGLDLAPGDVALRLNFATADGDGTIVDSRVGRSLTTGEAAALARSLTAADLLAADGVRAEVRSTVGHRGVLWLHPTDGRTLSPDVSNADPFYEKVGGMGQAKTPEKPRRLVVRPLSGSDEAARTAELVNRFLDAAVPLLVGQQVNARRALSGKKIANELIVRNAGALPSHPVPSFRERTGLEGAAITEMPVERGIARLLGLADLFVGPMGPDRDGALAERAARTRAALAEHEFVYVHLKGPDEPGHDGDALRKKEVVEALDRAFFGPFLKGIDWSELRVAVTADHATPCIAHGHTDDPVPLLLVGNGVPPDAPSGPRPKFGETAASHGSLGTRRGSEVLGLLRGPPGAGHE
jgi:2,3-bisphosphoglycerate-independent phosphoglycerate mutase